MIPSAVFVPAMALQTTFHSSAKFWKILRVCWRRLQMFCRPRANIQLGSLGKALWSVAWVQCWWPPVTSRQVTVFLLRSLCSCHCQEN